MHGCHNAVYGGLLLPFSYSRHTRSYFRSTSLTAPYCIDVLLTRAAARRRTTTVNPRPFKRSNEYFSFLSWTSAENSIPMWKASSSKTTQSASVDPSTTLFDDRPPVDWTLNLFVVLGKQDIFDGSVIVYFYLEYSRDWRDFYDTFERVETITAVRSVSSSRITNASSFLPGEQGRNDFNKITCIRVYWTVSPTETCVMLSDRILESTGTKNDEAEISKRSRFPCSKKWISAQSDLKANI